MKKFLILIFGLVFTAASCDFLTGAFNIESGVRGVFRSEDRGESFQASNTLAPNGNIGNLSVNNLVLDPNNPEIIYIASSNGIYKSTDAGKTWKYILSGLATTDVAVDPGNSKILYASGLAVGNGKIIKSVDEGTSWVDIYTEPSKDNTVMSIGLASRSPSVVMAGLNNGEIIRSFDSGKTWQAVTDLADRVSKIRFGSNGTGYALTVRKGLFRSIDEGITWSNITQTITGESLNSTTTAPTSVSAFHDLGLDVRQDGVIYLGTEQGLYRTVNDGVNWSFLRLPVKDSSLRVSATGVDPSNSNVIYASIALTIFKSVNGGLTWETKIIPAAGEVRSIQINPNTSNLVYLGWGSKR